MGCFDESNIEKDQILCRAVMNHTSTNSNEFCCIFISTCFWTDFRTRFVLPFVSVQMSRSGVATNSLVGGMV